MATRVGIYWSLRSRDDSLGLTQQIRLQFGVIPGCTGFDERWFCGISESVTDQAWGEQGRVFFGNLIPSHIFLDLLPIKYSS